MKYIILGIIILLQTSCKDKSEEETERGKLKAKAYYLYENDKYNEALVYFTSLINIDSTNGEYYFKRANCYFQSRQNSKAVKDNLRAVELNYRRDAAFYNLGLIYIFSNDSLALARYYFEKCLKENPKNSKALIMIKELDMRNPKLSK